jgi:hypothetical protein
VPPARAWVPEGATLAATTAGALAGVLAEATWRVLADAAPGCVVLLAHPASEATVRIMAVEVPSANLTVLMCALLPGCDHPTDDLETPTGPFRLGTVSLAGRPQQCGIHRRPADRRQESLPAHKPQRRYGAQIS